MQSIDLGDSKFTPSFVTVVCLFCFTVNVSVAAWLCNPGIPVPSGSPISNKGEERGLEMDYF